jgi:hypothetical protein
LHPPELRGEFNRGRKAPGGILRTPDVRQCRDTKLHRLKWLAHNSFDMGLGRSALRDTAATIPMSAEL